MRPPARTRPLLALLPLLLAAVLLPGCAADATVVTPPQREEPSAATPPAPETPEPGLEPEPIPETAPQPQPESAAAAPRVTQAVVTRHTDGDTAWFRLEGGAEEKVRFIGVDTPEVYGQVEAYGKEASAYTARAIPLGAAVWLETDAELRDRYGRLLAYIWLERPGSAADAEVRAKMLNARIVLDGYGQIATYPPNVRYVDYFTRYQTEARDGGRGLWALEANPANAPPAASAPAPGAGSTASGTTVYITKTGEKYHADGCRYLSQSKISISLADAKARGYEPCKGCQPPQ
jgi:micrococcal nuclease